MKRIVLLGILIIVTLIVLVVHREWISVQESSSEMSASSVQVNEKTLSKSEETNTFETTKNVPRFRYKHNSSPFAVDGGGFARFEIDHDLKELSWQESHRRNSQARRFGKRGKITLNIVDLEGNPIPNAKVHYFFNISDDTSVHATHVYTETDENGILSLEGRSIDYVYFIVSKEGYYDTKHFYSFLVRKHDCYEGGRWIPWNPTLEVTLKPIRNPEKRIIEDVKVWLPEQNTFFGFDCEIGDLVEPYGKGKIADFDIQIVSDASAEAYRVHCFTTEVTIVAHDENGGFISIPSDIYSDFKTEYEARSNGYQRELFFSYKITGAGAQYVNELNPVQPGKYLAFRSRVRRDKDGNILSAHYGKILSKGFSYGYNIRKDKGAVNFRYYFNPVENDRNMEGIDTW